MATKIKIAIALVFSSVILAGCAADPQNDPATLRQWNEMSRPKF